MSNSIEGVHNGSYFLLTYSPAFGKGEFWGVWNGVTRIINNVTPEQWEAIKHAAQHKMHPTYGSLPPSEVFSTPEDMPTPKVNLVPPISG